MFVPKAVFIMEFKFLPLLKLKFTLTQFRGSKNKKRSKYRANELRLNVQMQDQHEIKFIPSEI